MLGEHTNRKFVAKLKQYSDLHLNILNPKARAANHYHKKVSEIFINIGPEDLILYLKDSNKDSLCKVKLKSPTLNRVIGYCPKIKISHTVENPNRQQIILLIIVNEDDPNVVYMDPII